jgi:1-acyl-sn-glycerol-3-phosphate acyltransferase
MTVANHISYVDVLLIAAALPTVFVTSTEVRDTPGLGFLCRMAGCAFVDRRSARGLRGEIAALASVVRSGFHVAVFPEATSTRGDRVLPFKAALFEAARLSGRPLRAAVVEYDANVLPHISYAGDDRFLPHLVRLLGSRSTNAQVRWVAVDAAPAALHARELAEWAHAAIVRGRTLPAANDGGAPPDSVRPRHEHRSIRPRPTTN